MLKVYNFSEKGQLLGLQRGGAVIVPLELDQKSFVMLKCTKFIFGRGSDLDPTMDLTMLPRFFNSLGSEPPLPLHSMPHLFPSFSAGTHEKECQSHPLLGEGAMQHLTKLDEGGV